MDRLNHGRCGCKEPAQDGRRRQETNDRKSRRLQQLRGDPPKHNSLLYSLVHRLLGRRATGPQRRDPLPIQQGAPRPRTRNDFLYDVVQQYPAGINFV